MGENDFLHITTQQSDNPTGKGYWKVLVIDDDKFIHQVTLLVLKNLLIENKNIRLYSAYSAQQAKQILSQHKDIALAFIDVVMETHDAGLTLIRWIRETLNNHSIRIILRTGQDSHTLEEYAIKTYDINDYKDKAELTANKLISTTYTAIRSYRDIINLENQLTQLNVLIKSAANDCLSESAHEFSNHTFIQLIDLLTISNDALHVLKLEPSIVSQQEQFQILGQQGEFTQLNALKDLPPQVYALICRSFKQKKTLSHQNYQIIFSAQSEYSQSVFVLKDPIKLTQFQLSSLNLYLVNMALNFENISFKLQMEAAQIELIRVLSDAIETRSPCAGEHGKKVALFSQKIAELFGCEQKICSAIAYAAPLHDIGKIMVPESILNKPAKLDQNEWQIVKQHSSAGANLLAHSQYPLTQTAVKIAQAHHESWDGTGYPKGLSADEIPLEARIVCLADVLSVLAEPSCYRQAWPMDKIKDYVTEQSGKKFDPTLAKLVIQNFDTFKQIQTQLSAS
ncbi:DUF3369 domain-containing protein [Catenovulum sp. 2E275]|uniref:HD domain-containing phosphohydrolase n=1 Tax=Catenovulum sp. 2E275 TaxID=2980497 RepID=UPI0021D1F907|nr:HD domain-containing phosphohydrolase [Catenovulum sp. 2E275]MCU4674697.1 DUF3369 domain-containing protein [Catenovulum sp. 2E275]